MLGLGVERGLRLLLGGRGVDRGIVCRDRRLVRPGRGRGLDVRRDVRARGVGLGGGGGQCLRGGLRRGVGGGLVPVLLVLRRRRVGGLGVSVAGRLGIAVRLLPAVAVGGTVVVGGGGAGRGRKRRLAVGKLGGGRGLGLRGVTTLLVGVTALLRLVLRRETLLDWKPCCCIWSWGWKPC
ncbi:hypothetical protein [Streptosporangium roseum]|uniref:hypothetical protein n=1 Tax=Streptosporangium roseum TaxID=2001 RepID=UPI0012DCF493|nr:hypothetical protein [Streptosporangium roseum]